MFGCGMVLSRGCASRMLVLSANGNLRALLSGLVFAVTAQAAYRAALQLAVEHNCQSIALPSLGTGAYGYPLDRASRVALGTAIEFLRGNRAPALVKFVLFDNGAFGAFAAALEELSATGHSGSTT